MIKDILRSYIKLVRSSLVKNKNILLLKYGIDLNAKKIKEKKILRTYFTLPPHVIFKINNEILIMKY